jgi:hypothetical protein
MAMYYGHVLDICPAFEIWQKGRPQCDSARAPWKLYESADNEDTHLHTSQFLLLSAGGVTPELRFAQAHA